MAIGGDVRFWSPKVGMAMSTGVVPSRRRPWGAAVRFLPARASSRAIRALQRSNPAMAPKSAVASAQRRRRWCRMPLLKVQSRWKLKE